MSVVVLHTCISLISVCFCLEAWRLAESEICVECGVFEGIDLSESIWFGEEEGGCKDIGKRGIFGDDPGSKELLGGFGGVGVDDVVMISPAAAIGATCTQGALGHFD